jgi:hypothetical protein
VHALAGELTSAPHNASTVRSFCWRIMLRLV